MATITETKDTCPHVDSGIRAPNVHDKVHKTECTKCFDTDESPGGVDVCLTCFNGSCTGQKQHNHLHNTVAKHHVVCNIIKKEKPREKTAEELEREKNPKTLDDVLNDKGPSYEFTTQVRCLTCKCNIQSTNAKVAPIVAALLKKDDASVSQEMKYEEKRRTCPHTENLKQDPDATKVQAKGVAHCSSCDINQDLWLCLTCGYLGCSRKIHERMGGGGGNNHMVDHNASKKHTPVVKMGTVTAEGTADIWCYECDRNVIDPHFAAHLKHLGIDMSSQEKTSKTMAELELEKTLDMDFDSVIGDDGKEAVLAYGAGKTGLQNLGNTCYMASVLQVLFTIPSFQRRYFGQGMQHLTECKSSRPAECWFCQWAKLGEGLMSGRYSPAPSKQALELHLRVEDETKNTEKKQKVEKQAGPLQPGISPAMFRKLVTANSETFQSKQQQDAAEFFDYIMYQIKQKENKSAPDDPTTSFEFTLENRLECTSCHRVKYSSEKTSQLPMTIPHEPPKNGGAASGDKAEKKDVDGPPTTFAACVKKWAEGETITGWKCPQCNKPCTAKKTPRFTTFPDVLTVVLQRFVTDAWVPRKLSVEVNVEPSVDFDAHRGTGLLPGEQELPEANASANSQAAALSPDPALLRQLMDMGFSENRCARALLAVQNAGAEPAMNHLFAHMDDATQDLPIEKSSGAGPAKPGPPPEAVATLASMGFEGERALYALSQTDNDVMRAIDWLMSHMDDPIPSASGSSGAGGSGGSGAPAEEPDPHKGDQGPASYRLVGIITHLGPSTARGHYIAHLLKEGKWLKFNDTKVCISENPRERAQGYMLFFRRAGK